MSEAITPDLKPAAFKGETTPTGSLRVVCGGPAFSRHPQVYLSMTDNAAGQPSHVVCPYCSHTFIYTPSLAVPGAASH